MISLLRSVRFARSHCGLAVVLLVGCRSDCVHYPCPAPTEAIALTVTGAGFSGAPPGLAVAIDNDAPQAGRCDAAGVCHIFASPGAYRLTITANGFLPRIVDVTVTGETAGCNTCGHIDRQQLSAVLQPAP